MQDPGLIINVLNELKQQGVKLAIDDFGTGYSSLSYLYRFPIDVLKVGKSFIQNLLVDRNDALISQPIINPAHGMNMKVIAEGVETQEQLELLNSQSCDEIQGYLFNSGLPVQSALDGGGHDADAVYALSAYALSAFASGRTGCTAAPGVDGAIQESDHLTGKRSLDASLWFDLLRKMGLTRAYGLSRAYN